MGKRRRTGDVKRKMPKNGENQAARKSAEDGEPQRNEPDIDEDCVQYQSSSDDENANEKGAREDADENGNQDSSSEDDDDGSEPELGLGAAAEDESDVEVSLEFYDPTSADIAPVQNFLLKYASGVPAKKKPLDGRKLAEAICAQTRVGTTIRVTDDDAPIGFISCLNVRDHAGLLKPIKKHLLRMCESRAELGKLASVVKDTFDGNGRFERERMGLIVCERVVNLPPLVLPKLLEALFCEIEWAVEDEPTEEEREAFRFGWYLYITEVYYTEGSLEAQETQTETRKEVKKKRKVSDSAAEQIAFLRVEDEAFHQYASMQVSWSVGEEEGGKGGVKRKRMAMVINANKIGAIRDMVGQLVGFVDENGGAEAAEATGGATD